MMPNAGRGGGAESSAPPRPLRSSHAHCPVARSPAGGGARHPKISRGSRWLHACALRRNLTLPHAGQSCGLPVGGQIVHLRCACGWRAGALDVGPPLAQCHVHFARWAWGGSDLGSHVPAQWGHARSCEDADFNFQSVWICFLESVKSRRPLVLGASFFPKVRRGVAQPGVGKIVCVFVLSSLLLGLIVFFAWLALFDPLSPGPLLSFSFLGNVPARSDLAPDDAKLGLGVCAWTTLQCCFGRRVPFLCFFRSSALRLRRRRSMLCDVTCKMPVMSHSPPSG